MTKVVVLILQRSLLTTTVLVIIIFHIFRQIQQFSNRKGAARSRESHQIYDRIETYSNNLAKYLFYFTTFICGSLCISSGLVPISYMIFGFPSPTEWLLPLPAA